MSPKPTRYLFDSAEGGHFNATWFLSAPWAHPVWKEYVVLLYDLRPWVGKRTVIHKPGATHEFLLLALDPATPYQLAGKPKVSPLHPPNLGYQFIAPSDDAAIRRLQVCVAQIELKTLSPDTDFRSQWDELFNDGHTLVRSMFSEMQESRSAVRH